MRRTSGLLILVTLAALGQAFLAAQEPPPAPSS